MNATLLLTMFCLLVLSISSTDDKSGKTASAELRVMSFNIRNDNPDDGEHNWKYRKPRVAEVLSFHQPDVAGFQEVYANQLADLETMMPGYDHVGVGRTDGKADGEFAPIFFNTKRLELVDQGTFWLSPTPDKVGSVGWDANLERIATWARLRDKQTGQTTLAMNTHFDHAGEQARTESAKLILEQLNALAGEDPVILTGDFNATPDSDAFATLSSKLTDARSAADTTLGPAETFGGFEPGSAKPVRIDYVWTSPALAVRRFATLSMHWNGKHASDHFPVMADVVLAK